MKYKDYFFIGQNKFNLYNFEQLYYSPNSDTCQAKKDKFITNVILAILIINFLAEPVYIQGE